MNSTELHEHAIQFYNDIVSTKFIHCAGWYILTPNGYQKHNAYPTLKRLFHTWKKRRGLPRDSWTHIYYTVKRLSKNSFPCNSTTCALINPYGDS